MNVVDLFVSGGIKGTDGVLSSPGLIWRAGTNSFAAGSGNLNTVQAMATGNDVIVAATDGGGAASDELARSTDYGKTFGSALSTNHTKKINALVFANDTFVAAGDDGEISLSTDDGATWGALKTNAFATNTDDIDAMVYDKVNKKYIAGGEAATTLLYSSDASTWSVPTTMPASHPGTASVLCMATDGNGRVIACAGAYVTISTDGGVTWTAWADSGLGNNIYDIVHTDGRWILAGYAEDFRESVDGGVTWTTVDDGHTATGTVAIQSIVETGTGWLFATGLDESVYFGVLSIDNGLTWSETYRGQTIYSLIDQLPWCGVLVDTGPHERIVLGCRGGETWYSNWLEAGAGIVEQGSNSNGEYVIFSSGLQICWQSGLSAACTTTYNANIGTYGWSFYYSSAQSKTFPKQFGAAPTVMPTGQSTSTDASEWVTVTAVTTTGADFRPRSYQSATLKYGYIAIGYTA